MYVLLLKAQLNVTEKYVLVKQDERILPSEANSACGLFKASFDPVPLHQNLIETIFSCGK